MQDQLKANQKQINKFKWILNYLNPDDRITDDDIEQARQVSLESLISQELKPAGKNKKCCCMFHEDKTPSFIVFPENRWHCFGCNEGGSVIDFVMKKENLDFIDAVRLLKDGY